MLGETGVERWRWLGLYAFAGLALWSSGMQQAAECLDPERSRQRAVRLGDAAVLALLSALLGRAVVRGAALADEQRGLAMQVAVLAVGALLALVTALYLRRRPTHRARLGVLPSAGIGLAIGGAAGWALRGQGAPFPIEIAIASLPSILGEELIFRYRAARARGALATPPPRRRRAGGRDRVPGHAGPVAAGAIGVVVVSSLRAATGRTVPGFLARATFVLLVSFQP